MDIENQTPKEEVYINQIEETILRLFLQRVLLANEKGILPLGNSGKILRSVYSYNRFTPAQKQIVLNKINLICFKEGGSKNLLLKIM